MGSSTVEEDDWETAEISLPSASLSSKTAPLPSLRPQAQTFQPRPSQPNPPQRQQPQTQASSSHPQQPTLLQRRPNPQQQQQQQENDEGDDWFRGNRPMSNRQIWDSANSRPTPTQIISPLPLPTPKVQLLRRPASSSPSNNEGANKGGNGKMKSLEEREEQYRLARERIFGPESGSGSGASADVDEQEGKISRGNSKSGSGSGSKRGSPIPNKDRDPWDGLIPSQIRSGSNTPNPNGRKTPNDRQRQTQSPKMSDPRGGGVVRQPIGPGDGVGFGGGR
ncbi:hypothetical protein V866_005264 [Kwoniella sp. B9012]|uniref:SUZ domain-containing protein n=1 Tax=Kwoniella europaea PYCC6329 TaxID=1423913 RepID=A0AAX4KL44_9TREE